MHGRETITSYYMKRFLLREEYPLDEIQSVPKRFWCAIDSRPIIREYVPGLYFIIPVDYRFYKNEFLSGDTFKIKEIYSRMQTQGISTFEYNNEKTKSAGEYGFSFARFPSAYSLKDSFISPSGHAMRIAFSYFSYCDISLGIQIYLLRST